MEYVGVSIIERNQTSGVKLNKRGVNKWCKFGRALKQRGVKQVGC